MNHPLLERRDQHSIVTNAASDRHAGQLVRLMSGEPARPDIKGASIATPDSLLLNEQEHDTVRTLQYPLHMLALAPSNQNIHHYLLVSR